MSAALDLDKIRPGFSDPVRDSQATFRKLMEAIARPGVRQELGPAVDPPAGLSTAAAAAALTLFDFETPVWLDPTLRGADAEAWLRFHCGCPLTGEAKEAAFALVVDMAGAPPLDAFNLGAAKYPDRSTTVILQVPSLDNGETVILTGPGVKDQAVVVAQGLPQGFWGQLQDNNAQFQFGVDVFLVSRQAVIAVPRSSRIQIQGD